MYSRSYLTVMTVLVYCLTLFVGVGCNKDDSDDETLVVTYENFDFSQQSCWIVVCDAQGEQVLAVRRVMENGPTVFYDDFPSKVTVSFIKRENLYSTSRVVSYANVPPMSWTIKNDPFPPRGEVVVTAHYPEGDYSRLTICTPSVTASTSAPGQSSYTFSYLPHNRLDNGAMSILGILKGNSATIAGWILDAPFYQDTTNTYHIQLDQPTFSHQVSLSRLTQELSLYGCRSSDEIVPFELDRESDSTGSSEIELNLPEFPVDFYRIYASSTTPQFSYHKNCATLPTVLTIPEKSISASYDPELGIFTDLAIHGEADAIGGRWYTELSEQSVLWTVLTTMYSGEIRRPLLPDSLLDAMQVSASIFAPNYVVFYDFSPCNGWDAYVRLAAKNELYGDEIDEYYSSINSDGFGESESNVLLEPTPEWR